MTSFPVQWPRRIVIQYFISLVRGSLIVDTDNLSILGGMLSGPHVQ